MARPTTFNQKTFDIICARLAEGETLLRICRDDGMPARSTVQGWVLRDDPPGISGIYARAREMQMHGWADENIEISDTPVEAVKTTVKGDGTVEEVTGDAVERSKLRIETRKWLMARVLAKVYGDRMQHTGDADNPIEVSVIRRVIVDPRNPNT